MEKQEALSVGNFIGLLICIAAIAIILARNCYNDDKVSEVSADSKSPCVANITDNQQVSSSFTHYDSSDDDDDDDDDDD